MREKNISLLFEKHRLRQNGLNACLTLLELAEFVQQHRGITLSIQGGNQFFETRLLFKQNEVNALLESLANRHPGLIDATLYNELASEWRTLERHWPRDDAFGNFLIHCHYLSAVLKAISDIANLTGHDDIDELHQRVATLALRKVPAMIECIAQSRGLAVHMVSTQDYDTRFIQRLQYLGKTMLDDHIQILQELQNIDTALTAQHPKNPGSASITSRLQQTIIEMKAQLLSEACYDQLRKYSQSLEHLYTKNTGISPSSDYIFSRATHIISAHYQTITKVIRGLHYSTDPDLSSWINIGSC